jgi:hypothetical protein
MPNSKATTKVLALLVISLSIAFAFESYYKFRIYKDLLQNVFSKNFRLILDRAARYTQKDTLYIDNKQTEILMQIQPRGGNWADLQLEIFYDEGQIILEGHELEFIGEGTIKDPQTQ